MLKVIKRVLRLSGDLSKRIYASFVFSFIDSIVAMFPVGAVFYTHKNTEQQSIYRE